MKKNLLKLAAFAMVAVMGLGALTGCSEKAEKTEGKTETAEKLIMGTNAAFEPFEFVTTADKGVVGEFDGIDVVIANEIAKSMGKELVIEDMEFDGLLASVQTGKIDMAVAGITANDERRKNCKYSSRLRRMGSKIR